MKSSRESAGECVAPLFDLTGNGRPEMRVLSYSTEPYMDMIGGEEITHIFDGETGEFLFAVITNDEFDPWQPLPGDVTGDGSVTQADIDIIMANMGLEGDHLTMFDVNVNGDGVVDALDLAIALDHLGQRLFDVW